MSDFSELQTYAYDLKSAYAERDSMLDQMQKMYLLQWDEQQKLQQQFAHMHITLSPDARNKIRTAVRLMTASAPQINVPKELQQEIGADIGDKIERMAGIMLRQSDRIRGNPVAYDAVLSGLLYDEIHISVNDTSEMLRAAEGSSKAVQARYKRANELTPFIFDVHDPHGCYADFDALGLCAWARCVDMTRAGIASKYGKDGEAALSGVTKKQTSTETLKVWTLWTLDSYACWIEGSSTPIHNEPHNLPTIPVVVHTVEGSRALFTDVEDQREPFLYTLWKSNVWNMANLSLSAQSTNMASAMWPQLSFVSAEREAPDMDMSVPWGVFHLFPNEQLSTWNKNLIDPGLIQMWQTAQALSTSSTLYDQVAGAPLGSGASFSETALLNQAGRLPLVGVQRKTGWALGDALRKAFLLMKDGGGAYSGGGKSVYAEVKAMDIPDSLEIEVNMDVALPQDRLQMANIVNQLRNIMPTEWLLENVFQVRQPGQMIDQAMSEQAYQALWQAYVQQKVAEYQMQQQQAMQPPQAPPQMGAPGANTSMSMSANGLPPELGMMGGQGPQAPSGAPNEGEYGLQ